jgi:hypothetical protein
MVSEDCLILACRPLCRLEIAVDEGYLRPVVVLWDDQLRALGGCDVVDIVAEPRRNSFGT